MNDNMLRAETKKHEWQNTRPTDRRAKRPCPKNACEYQYTGTTNLTQRGILTPDGMVWVRSEETCGKCGQKRFKYELRIDALTIIVDTLKRAKERRHGQV